MSADVLGLALGGGGALGAAHVGVLKALQERHIRPSVIAGTSAGALVGAAYAAGLPVKRIEQLVREATWSTFGRLSISPRFGLLDSSALLDTIARIGDEPDIENLPRRFAAVATDPAARTGVIIDRGPLGAALRASIAVPGIFPPIPHNGRMLVDGGLAANLPIRAARHLGATHVIGVRLRPEWDRLKIVPDAANVAQLEYEAGVLVIRPDLTGMSQWSRVDVPRLIGAGYDAAHEALSLNETSQRGAA
ncbi:MULTISPECIES: patatin-like phospholipase family protein [Microbacteriaceae]|uniref:PNPLA domain-containing protein n=1 Tax=Gulosibacter molinativorax TaxID=256821 RepID=A0ABT7CBL5_9MICO|nr:MULTISPECIES: patatin-like phospholipase family protein [Microbacteriaceae]MDJ1372579.1 hypothetical protein [Gulosibacter molinativorax]MDO8383124.1 patatin-like phospholipase family protein [Microbacterium sp.]QUY61523.1 NTE family protein RssA [Gulosibacter molinativorax]